MSSKKSIFYFFLVCLVFAGLTIFTLINSDKIAMLNPKGLIALKQLDIMAVSIWLMLIVVLPVFVLTFFIIWRYREGNQKAEYDPNWNDSTLIEVLWWGFPFAIIVVLSVIAWNSSHDLDPYKPLESKVKPLTIQVVALQWQWLFIYPEEQIATTNFIQFPEKTPINFEISANSPMNSFWIPQLGGQIYAMPGMATKLHLIADEPGEYYGSSANISGIGFAGMNFIAKASSKKDFEEWVQSIKRSSSPLGIEEYKTISKPTEYPPAATFVLQKKDLFDWIVMEPMMEGR